MGPEDTKSLKRYERHLEKAKEWTINTLKGKAAKALQKAIRAEAAAFVGNVRCVVDGSMATRYSPKGECVCVTCGAIKDWKASNMHGLDGIDAGHFLASRTNSILFEEFGINPQCTHCNRTGGRPEAYEMYMREVYGQEIIDELRRLKNQVTRKFDKEELVHMRLSYIDRIKEAEGRLKDAT